MTPRSEARKRAFQILFEADQRGVPTPEVLADWKRHALGDDEQSPISAYTTQLVEGYAEYTKRIDELIATYSVGWALERMPVVDRNILRLSTYELLYENTPDAVVIDEAVQLAKEFSTDDSPAFVNGLLDRLKSLKPSLRRSGD